MKIFLILLLTLTQMINLISLRREKNDKLENYTGNNMSPTVRLSPEESLNGHHASKTYIQTKTSSNAPFNKSYHFKESHFKKPKAQFKPKLGIKI